MDPRELARLAYERGRIELGARTALVALLLCAGFHAWDGLNPLRAGATLALVPWSGWLTWSGRSRGRAVLPGLLGGLAAAILPLLARGAWCVGGSCSSTCMLACVIGGAVAGVVVGSYATDGTTSGRERATAGGIAMLMGAQGCACVGWGGVVGMGLALALTAAPLAVRPAAAARG
jgi:hypothetical protein